MRVSVRTYELTRRTGNFFGGDLRVEDQRPVSTSWSAPRIPGLPLGFLVCPSEVSTSWTRARGGASTSWSRTRRASRPGS